MGPRTDPLKPLVITGCQRSGTAYIAAVITACGWWCSHERVFSDQRQATPRLGMTEASWAAVPYLPQLDAYVVHQVRHPLSVVASCLARSTFAGKMRRSARWAARQHPPIVRPGDDHLARVMRYWLRWNWLVERHTQHRWRIEDLTAVRLAEVLTACDRPTTVGRAAQALALIPADVNHTRPTRPMSWSDLPPGRLKTRVRRMARRYGYH